MLERRLAEEGNYSKLAQAITTANADNDNGRVDRRKLRVIVDRQDVTLSLRELLALDVYLTPFGESLADRPILENPAPLRALADRHDVTIVLGAYPRPKEQRNYLSRWDVRSMAHLQQAIKHVKPDASIAIDDFLFSEETPDRPGLLDGAGPSVACIGSPRACYISEYMLADMFRMKPFDPEPDWDVPFHFLWTAKARVLYDSTFRVEADAIRDLDARLADDLDRDRLWGVLQVRKELFPVRFRTDEQTWTAYGVVAAQRRATGQVWMVIAGLSGPATFAAASALADGRTSSVPECESPDQHSPVHLDVVRATVFQDYALPGDQRVVTDYRVVHHAVFTAI
ncbi:MAG: hypothetical protein ACE5EX_06615 [Phycisphaerae bacterium]